MSEHARIATYLAPLAAGEAGAFSLRNDAASLTPPAGCQLVLTTDSVIAGIHVPHDASAEVMLRKLVRRNLSDLAAMGASPWRYLLNIHLPKGTPESWWQQAAATLAAEQARYGMQLAGGDCTSAEGATAHVTLTAIGTSTMPALLRSGACVGEQVFVGGPLGDAALFLCTQNAAFASAYFAPEPQLALGAALRGIASACLDISDGLLQDAAQLASASGVQLAIAQPAIPLSAAAQAHLAAHPADWDAVVSGGDDYVLLFTAPPEAAAALPFPVTATGEVKAGSGVLLLDAAGRNITPARLGYTH